MYVKDYQSSTADVKEYNPSKIKVLVHYIVFRAELLVLRFFLLHHHALKGCVLDPFGEIAIQDGFAAGNPSNGADE